MPVAHHCASIHVLAGLGGAKIAEESLANPMMEPTRT
jgi:hypothetical protein